MSCPESKLLGAARMALECLDPNRARRWDRAFVLAELRTAIAAADGRDISPEEAGYSEGQADHIRLMALAPEMRETLEAVLPMLQYLRDAVHDLRRGRDDPRMVGLVKRVESLLAKARPGPMEGNSR